MTPKERIAEWHKHPTTQTQAKAMQTQADKALEALLRGCHGSKDPDVVRLYMTYDSMRLAVKMLGGVDDE